MKSKLFLIACFALSSLFLRAETKAPFDWPTNYSVDTETSVGAMKTSGKMFVADGKMRTESDAGGVQSISIVRPDKKVIYSLMPAQKMYIEMPMPEAPKTEPVKGGGEAPQMEQVGKETINGVATTKYKQVSGAMTVFYYVGADRKLVRMSSGEGASAMTIDYKNFKSVTPEAALFEVPAGFFKPGEQPQPAEQPQSSGEAQGASDQEKPAEPAEQPKPEEKKKKKIKLF